MLFSNAFLVDSFPVAWGFFETGLIPAHTDCIYNYTGEEGESRNSWRKVKRGRCNVKKEKLEGLKKGFRRQGLLSPVPEACGQHDAKGFVVMRCYILVAVSSETGCFSTRWKRSGIS
jgi:hypothetical protein